MKSLLQRTLIALLPAWIVTPAKADYSPDFSLGQMPAEIAVANEAGIEPASAYYKHGWTSDGWTLERFGSKGYVLVCPSHTAAETPQPMRSVLTLPAYDVTGDTWLRWEASSMIARLPEAYAVEIVAEGSDMSETLIEVAAENADWTTRMISLGKYAGKRCRVSFVCKSANCYELMLGGIALTEPKTPVWSGKNLTAWFGDMSGTNVKGTVTNYGAPAEVSAVILLDADGNETDRMEIGRVIGTAEDLTYSFDGTAEKDTRTSYSVRLVLADGSTVSVKELAGSYFSSTFTRRHLVDKATGFWCNNCPQGNLQLETLSRQFGEALIPVETHVRDLIANTDYFSNLKLYAIPAFRMDRHSKGNNGFKDMASFYDIPANHDVVFEKISLTSPDELTLRVVVKHPEGENADFKLGYVITADLKDVPEYYQSNNLTSVSAERYYFLPSTITSDLLEFKHVSVTSEHAFEGLDAVSSFRSEGGMCCSTYEFTVPRPALVSDFRDASVVAFALDNSTSIVLNAATVRLDKDFEVSGISDIVGDSVESDGTVEYFTIQGIRVTNPSGGIFIRRQGSKSSKIILK